MASHSGVPRFELCRLSPATVCWPVPGAILQTVYGCELTLASHALSAGARYKDAASCWPPLVNQRVLANTIRL